MPTIGGIVVPTSGQSTGRRTLIDIVNELARPINAADDTILALAADAFRSAVRYMNRKGLWPWEIQDEEVAITSGERFSTVSGVVKLQLAMHELTASGGTRKRKIGYISYDRFLEKYNMDISSQTLSYTIPNMFETGQIRWIPTPASTITAKFSFYRATPAPRNDNEAVEIPDSPLEVYMARAWYEFLKRLPSQQQAFPISLAMADSRLALRELSAHVNTPGDRSRQITHGGYGVG